MPIDGTKDEAINIRGLSDYVVRQDETESDEDDLFKLDSSEED